MVTGPQLMDAVDARFAVRAREYPGWADPHPDRSPLDDEYSRVTAPQRWQILGARADAWANALTDLGLATVERDVAVTWSSVPMPQVTRADRIAPTKTGAISLVVGRSGIGAVPDAGVTLGVGDPLIPFGYVPDCGCDACDSGSQDALDVVDEYVGAVVDGSLRYLWRGARSILVTTGGTRRGSGLAGRRVDRILARPAGWQEIRGEPWM